MDLIRLRVNLKHVVPRVMRSLLVPLDIQLQNLHFTLQVAVGWHNLHLYSFETRQTTWVERAEQMMDFGYGRTYSIENVNLREFLTLTGARQFLYTYNFRDCWEHTIHVGSIREAKAGQLYPQLTTVKGCCPPESAGGPWRYNESLGTLADENHPEHEDWKQSNLELFNLSDTEENYLRKSVENVARLISQGKVAKEFFGYHPSDDF